MCALAGTSRSTVTHFTSSIRRRARKPPSSSSSSPSGIGAVAQYVSTGSGLRATATSSRFPNLSATRWCCAPPLWRCQCMPVVVLSNTCMRYVPMLRVPVSGSFVKTSGSVMYGPPSSGQHVRIGSSSSVPPFCTTSWQGASFTVFGIRSPSRFTSGSIFRASNMPLGACGVMSSSISFARSSSEATPSARHIRSIDPKTFAATGMS